MTPGTLSAANYTFTTFNSGTLTVNPASLTVTADNQTKLYGDPDPTLTATITGFVNGDDSSVVSGSADVTTMADASSPVGSYTIAVDAGTLSAANYTFATFNSGTLTVNPATLTVTADNQTKLYGDPDPTLTATITGFVNGDDSSVVSGSADVTTTADASSPVGSYTIAVDAGTLSAANYTFTTFNSGTLTVNPAPLTVTADNQTKLYGDPDPTLTATITGFVNGDDFSVVSGSADVTTTADASSPVGSYTIAVDAGTLSAANYTFTTFNSGTLTVNPASLTVTADNQTTLYGNPVPTLTATITGFVNGESLATSGVTGSPDLSCAADQTSPPGAYAITVGPGTLAAGNYDFTFVSGTLTINQPLVSAAPTSVVLAPGSDTGYSSCDNLTCINHCLSVTVSGVTVGATVELFADGQMVGTLAGQNVTGDSAVVTTDDSVTLADGVHVLTARQIAPNQTESPDSPSLTITIDTVAPTVLQATPHRLHKLLAAVRQGRFAVALGGGPDAAEHHHGPDRRPVGHVDDLRRFDPHGNLDGERFPGRRDVPGDALIRRDRRRGQPGVFRQSKSLLHHVPDRPGRLLLPRQDDGGGHRPAVREPHKQDGRVQPDL